MEAKDLKPGRRYINNEGDEFFFVGFDADGAPVGHFDDRYYEMDTGPFTPAPVKKTGWATLYGQYPDVRIGGFYPTEDAAHLGVTPDGRVVPIAWEDTE